MNNRRKVGLLDPMRDKNSRPKPGRRRDDTCDHDLSRSWKVKVCKNKKQNNLCSIDPAKPTCAYSTNRRTQRVAANREIAARVWTSELLGAWDAAQDPFAHAVALSRPKSGCAVLMFPDFSDERWGSFLA